MDYNMLYQRLVSSRQSKGRPAGYIEVHHIVPRSFGGGDDATNLVPFTAREHFIAHRLLAKIYPESGMVHAAFKMACVNITMKRYRVTSRVYEQLRIAHAHRVSTDPVSKLKKSIAGKGKKQSAEHISARTASRLENGPWLSEETKVKIGDGNRGKVGTWAGKIMPAEYVARRNQTRKDNGNYTWTDEHKAAQVARLTGQPSKKPELTEAERQKLREEKSKPVTCPHCGKVGAMMVMPRWHFDNCPKRLT